MTFTEAALEVLRTAGEALHYKKITELAIERNLLSHVGKTPEVTMSSRLAMMVKKDRGQAPIIKVKPGVFAIRESALQGATLSPEALAAISEVEGLDEAKVAVGAEAAPTEEAAVSIPAKAPALPGSDVFPEEEGDDDPILAGLEQESEGGERSGRRRRRRRRRKGDKPETTVEAGNSQRAERAERTERADNLPREPQRERFRERSRPERPDRSDRNERNERNDRERGERQDRGDRFERQARNNDERSDGARADESLDWNRQPADGDLLGKDLADAVASVLTRGDRTPHTFARVAELLVRRGRLSGSPAALAPTIAAAVRADIARAELSRSRPRFRLRAARLSLSDWHLPKGLQRAEQDMLSGAERYAAELRRALIQKLSELPTAGFAELLATWLNAEGVTALRAVRRPGSSGSEFHFAGTRKTGSEEVRLAIVVQRGSRDIDREGIIDVRGALHHYGHAQAAWVVTLGRITSGAREEAAAQAAACALFDGQALAAAMERLGVAVRRNVIAHHEIDYDLLEALGDSPEQRERREREQERERREHNERTRAANQARNRSRGPSGAPREDGEREREERQDQDAQERTEARPVKLRDADWDEDAAPLAAAADDEDSASSGESLAPRGYGLRDIADERREDGEAVRLRDELESDSDDSADDEDFSTSEESDEDFAAAESDADDSDSDDNDDSDEDSDDDDASDSDDADESDDADDNDDVDADEDYRASADDDSDADESDESDESEDAEGSDESDDTDDAEDSDEGSEEAEQNRERAGRVRRR